MSTKTNFTEKDFHNENGMLTSVWGPPLWHFLHTMSFNYPNCPTRAQRKAYKDFFYNLTIVMPCNSCRENLLSHLKKYPIGKHLKNRDQFSKYVYDLHETVNQLLNKTSGLSFEQIRNRYEHFRARCIKKKSIRQKHVGCNKTNKMNKTKTVLNIVPSSKSCPTLKIYKNCFDHHVV